MAAKTAAGKAALQENIGQMRPIRQEKNRACSEMKGLMAMEIIC